MMPTGNLLDKSRHRHALRSETGSRLVHLGQKFASCIIDTGDLPHIEFDLFVRARRGSPDVFCFRNPGTRKFAGEFQTILAAILMNRDS
jgi:hypothetical protein